MIERLKRIQKELGKDETIYCTCFADRVNELIDKKYDGQSGDEVDFSTLPESWCELCQKPVNTELIESIDKNISLIYGDETVGLAE